MIVESRDGRMFARVTDAGDDGCQVDIWRRGGSGSGHRPGIGPDKLVVRRTIDAPMHQVLDGVHEIMRREDLHSKLDAGASGLDDLIRRCDAVRLDQASAMLDGVIGRADSLARKDAKWSVVLLTGGGMRPAQKVLEVEAGTEDEARKIARKKATSEFGAGWRVARASRVDAVDPAFVLRESRAGHGSPVVIELHCSSWDGIKEFIAFLQYVKITAAVGHSFAIAADESADPPHKMFGSQRAGAVAFIDGDGDTRIDKILVNGEELK